MNCSQKELAWAFCAAGWTKGDPSKVPDEDVDVEEDAFLDACFDQLGVVLARGESVLIKSNEHAVVLIHPEGSDRVYPMHVQLPPPQGVPGYGAQAIGINTAITARLGEIAGEGSVGSVWATLARSGSFGLDNEEEGA